MKFPTRSLGPLLKLSLAIAIVVGGLYYCRQFTQRYVSEGLSRRAVIEQSLPVAPAVAAISEFELAGIEALVRAAAVTDEALAKVARREIDAKIATWRREAFEAKTSTEVAERWQRLLASLDGHAAEFTIDGRRWATQIALAGLEMDDVLLPDQSLPLAEASGKLLDQLGHGTPPLATTTKPAAVSPPPPVITPSPVAAKLSSPPGPIESFPTPAEPVNIAAATPAAVSPADTWQPTWQTPLANVPPQSQPTQSREPQPLEPAPIATAEMPTAMKTYRDMNDRELLASLIEHAEELLAEQEAVRSARGPASKNAPTVAPPRSPELAELRTALAERGYRTVPLAEVRILLSPDVPTRRRLVDALLTQNSSDSPRLLMLLAQDAAPEVRLAALSALSSSDDLEVVRAAWNLAMRDADPNVANLARQLTLRVGSPR